jgi:hypothetical protein
MTPGAVARRPLEYAVDVTVFTRHIPVRITQLEPGSEVIESGPLDGEPWCAHA